MILRYRVALPGIKGFARVYLLRSTMTLYDFHRIMGADMEFPVDQPIQFKALDEAGGLVARYAFFDLGFGTVDDISLEDTLEKGIASFQYFYDVPGRRSVLVICEGEVDEEPGRKYPVLAEVKGPNPVEFENGYVAYEDLPEELKHPQHHDPDWAKGEDNEDDFEDDAEDEDEEEDDEEGDAEEEVFDEDELP